ncbi:conserved Plasmodium protein, unknown function [Plasmodium relictum]|uniref:Uncharacterized protein n=1 Tax=Plasmodium relictum TaxID=85471 RepID=A0A1J1HHN4_PLARL|nr:conserved Plasmodium protein, unknown function [Plasmodium relictum]CRH03788.1 conserved Plasmodium protein, unknown function [Plasmodium relictum]
MKFKGIPKEKLNTHKLSYINLEKEISNKINNILNLIIFDINKKSKSIYTNDYINYMNDNLYKLKDKNQIFHNSINNLHIKWKYYNKISIGVLKEYVKLFHKNKKNFNLIFTNKEPLYKEKEEKLYRNNKDESDVNILNKVIKESGKFNEINSIVYKNIIYENTLNEKWEEHKNRREDNNTFINCLSNWYVDLYKDININDIKYVWLKHLIVIFKLLIDCNLKVDDKRKLDITKVITNFLKNKNIHINNDLYFSYTYMLSKINMIDKEMVILICNNIKNDYKLLSSLNKFYLFSSLHNFDFSCKKFQQIINYLYRYFYHLIKEKYIHIKSHRHFNDKYEVSNKDSLEKKKVNLNNNRIGEEIYLNSNNKIITPVNSKNKNEEFLIINNYLFDIYENLYKRKKYISYLDKVIFKYIINEELLKYNKIHLTVFKSIIKICDKDMLDFLFKKIIENIESYDTTEIYSMLKYFIKCQNELFFDFLLFLKKKNFENMNLKHIICLYLSINRILVKKYKRKKKKKNISSIQNYYIEEFLNINCYEYDELMNTNYTEKEEYIEDNLDTNNLMMECEHFLSNESKKNNNFEEIKACLEIIKNINENIITILTKKINYLNNNNIITILYNTCSTFSEKQIIFVNKLFSQLYEENYLIINFLHIYNKLFSNFVFYYSKLSIDMRFINLMENNKESIKLISTYEKKVENSFNYIKKRYYINEHALYDFSKYTIILNIYEKFFLDIFIYYMYQSNKESETYKQKLFSLIIHIYTHLQFIFFNSCDRIFPINKLELIFNYSEHIVKNINIYINSIIYPLKFIKKRHIFKSNKNEKASNVKSNDFCKSHLFLNSSGNDINLLQYSLFNEKGFNISSININENKDLNILYNNISNNSNDIVSINAHENIDNNINKFSSDINDNSGDNSIYSSENDIRKFFFIIQYINYICSYIYFRTNASKSLSIKKNTIYICLSLLRYNKENMVVINNIFKILKGMNVDEICKNIIFIFALDYIHEYCNIRGILIKLFRFIKKDKMHNISTFKIPPNNTNFKILTRYLKYMEKRYE